MASFLRSSSRSLALTLAFSCAPAAVQPVPSGVASGSPAASVDRTRVEVGAGTALGGAIEAYVTGFGRQWGEASAFSGYVAVAHDGRLVFGKAYGAADREAGAAATPDTRFRIGSISKSFTAIAILQLAERGMLGLEDPVRRFLPELPAFADGVTIHHCLTHTSGLPPLPDEPGLVAETGKQHPVAPAFASYKDRKPSFPPGERFEYSNAGYTILGAILERVSGRSYEDYLREHVFVPAGMFRTTTVSDPAPPDMAVGYMVDERDRITPARPITYVLFGSGNVITTVNDLLAWDRALAGTRLLGDAWKRRMLAPERDVGGIIATPAHYGLGWFVERDGDHDVFWHGGGVDGFESSFTRVPDAGLTVVVLSNVFGEYGLVQKVALAVQKAALTGKGPPPEDEPAAGAVDGSQVAALEGEYGMDATTRAVLRVGFPREVVEGWAGLSLVADGGHLFARWSGLPGPEVFRGPDGSLFTKQHGLRVVPEGGGAGPAPAVVLVKRTNRIEMRYVRLGTALSPAPSAACPPGMARLPGGATVASFCIDLSETTVAAYSRCVHAGACRPAATTVQFAGITDALRAKWSPSCNGARRDRLDHPANCVDWEQSAAYCRAQGKRLPTEEEWEWAARGGDQERPYPWGYRAPDAEPCWSGVQKRDGTCPIASYPRTDALGGMHDMAGNVGEWTSTAAPDGGHVMRGGGWNMASPELLRTNSRDVGDRSFRGPSTGIRCVR